jgi:hypothetical protein
MGPVQKNQTTSPFITADTIKEVLGQFAAFTIVHLNAKDAPAPHIHHHIKVVELTLRRPGWGWGKGMISPDSSFNSGPWFYS